MTNVSTAAATRELHFCDMRPPHEVQFSLERDLRTLFTRTMEHNKLSMRATAIVVGANYNFLLRFEAALPTTNCYSLRMDVSWVVHAVTDSEYYLKTSSSWFDFWTREFNTANPDRDCQGSAERYVQLCQEAMNAERQLESVLEIQQAIIVGLKQGGSYHTSHKEGGTNIHWKGDRFVRSDYGDYPNVQQFIDESDFLKMLRQFCYYDVTGNAGKDQLSEVDIWRLILRRMSH